MSCHHPLYMIDCGVKENGKRNLIFATQVSANLGLSIEELKARYGDRLVPVPCGHCIGCHLDRSKEWACRCVLESLEYDSNCFITLTYDEVHCPKRLRKSHFQAFMKRLRSAHPDIEIRFFACGEYGSKNGRPHYHAILFNFDFSDRELLSVDGNSRLYVSKELSKLWKYGISSVGELTFESCAYVARYTSKKVGSGFGDEFILMSRRPGLGVKYFKTHKDLIYLSDKIYGPFGASHKASVPRYFDKLAEDASIDLVKVKENRIRIANNLADLQHFLYHKEHTEDLSRISDEIIARRLLSLRRYI